MKKTIVLLALLLVLCALCGCAQIELPAAVSENHAAESESAFHPQLIADNIRLLGSYDYRTGGLHKLVLVLQNTTGEDCRMDFHIVFHDEAQDIIEKQSKSVESFAAQSAVALSFEIHGSFATYDYIFYTGEPAGAVVCINDELTCETAAAQDKATVSVTNHAAETAAGVEATVLFFKEERIVWSACCPMGDGEMTLAPGKTAQATVRCGEGFDTVKAYVSGYGVPQAEMP